MNYILLPTLQHAAIVRIASLLYDDYEIEKTLAKESTVPVSDIRKINQRWELIQSKIADQLSSLLPFLLRTAVAKFILPLHNQVSDWKRDHEYLLKHVAPRCSTWLLWKTDGTINRTQTAKKLVASKDIDPKVRFIMACTYFLEEEVKALWEKIKNVDGSKAALVGTNLAVRFWMEWLQKEDDKHWSEIIDDYFGIHRIQLRDIPLRISSFYHFLSRETKKDYISFVGNGQVHIDDFQMCVNKVEEAERAEIFQNKYLFALTVCLRWPFRPLFISMAEEVFSYLTVDEFLTLLHWMLNSFFWYGHEDFHLFEEFWQMSPTAFKNETKQRKRFIMITKSLFEEEILSVAFHEIVKKCYLH